MSRLSKTALTHFLSQIILSAAGFAGTFAIARLLGSDGLGTYTIAVGLGYFWLTLPANAVGSALSKRISERNDPGEHLTVAIVLNGIIALGLGLIVYISGVLLPVVVNPSSSEFTAVVTDHTGLVALLVVSSVGFRTSQAALNGEKQVGTSGILNAAERALRVVLQIFLVVIGWAVGGLIFATVVSLTILGSIGILIINTRPRRPSMAHITSLGAYAKYSWLGSLKGRAFGWMDTIVMSFFVSSSLIGIYEAAWGLASLLGMASVSVTTTLFPEMSELSASEEDGKIRRLLGEGLVYNGIFVIPGLVGAWVIGDRVLRIYGPGFSQGKLILAILVGAYALNV